MQNCLQLIPAQQSLKSSFSADSYYAARWKRRAAAPFLWQKSRLSEMGSSVRETALSPGPPGEPRRAPLSSPRGSAASAALPSPVESEKRHQLKGGKKRTDKIDTSLRARSAVRVEPAVRGVSHTAPESPKRLLAAAAPVPQQQPPTEE